ncbi:hypothetical protein EZS27_024323 [termite gut metagenome]|uniref:Uncharacterized protein n=1 Tax=termite gut metagenome TaxID=433724 RepID=A0A5J4QXB3_9ZZZZ
MTKTKKVWHMLFLIVIVGAVAAVVMLLWNAVIPPVIGWTSISYWQALGLLVLVRILLGGLGGFGHLHHKAFFHHHGHPNVRLHEELRRMSFNERREYIRKHLKEFHHFGSCDDLSATTEEKKDDK